jgi:ketosteroid isomerase-like protein
MKRATAFLACAVLLAGCVNPRVKKMEIDRAEVQARLHRYEGLMLAMDIPGIAAMFAPDGEMVNPKRPPVHGRDAIVKFLGDYSDFKVIANADTATSTLIDGDTAEQLGNYHQKVRSPDGKLFETSGRLEIEWVRGASGEWLIFQLAMFPGD